MISSELAPTLGIQAAPNTRFDNFLHESVQLGNKTTVRLSPGLLFFDMCIPCLSHCSKHAKPHHKYTDTPYSLIPVCLPVLRQEHRVPCQAVALMNIGPAYGRWRRGAWWDQERRWATSAA